MTSEGFGNNFSLWFKRKKHALSAEANAGVLSNGGNIPIPVVIAGAAMLALGARVFMSLFEVEDGKLVIRIPVMPMTLWCPICMHECAAVVRSFNFLGKNFLNPVSACQCKSVPLGGGAEGEIFLSCSCLYCMTGFGRYSDKDSDDDIDYA